MTVTERALIVRCSVNQQQLPTQVLICAMEGTTQGTSCSGDSSETVISVNPTSEVDPIVLTEGTEDSACTLHSPSAGSVCVVLKAAGLYLAQSEFFKLILSVVGGPMGSKAKPKGEAKVLMDQFFQSSVGEKCEVKNWQAFVKHLKAKYSFAIQLWCGSSVYGRVVSKLPPEEMEGRVVSTLSPKEMDVYLGVNPADVHVWVDAEDLQALCIPSTRPALRGADK